MKAFKYLVFLVFSFFSTYTYSFTTYEIQHSGSIISGTSATSVCQNYVSQRQTQNTSNTFTWIYVSNTETNCYLAQKSTSTGNLGPNNSIAIKKSTIQCPSATSVDLKVPTSSGSYVCTGGCQYKLKACVDVDFESGMTCSGISTGQDCGTPKPPESSTNPPVSQDPTNPTDKTEEQTTFENIMHVIGEKLDGIKDAITGGNQNQNGGNTGGSNGGTTGGDVTVNVDMSETNAKIDETNSLIDELTKWLQGEELGDDIFGDSEPPEKELTPQQLETNIFSGRAQCPADAKLSFNLLGGKTFTKTFEFTDWCDNLEIFGSLILIASYLFGAYIIVSKS